MPTRVRLFRSKINVNDSASAYFLNVGIHARGCDFLRACGEVERGIVCPETKDLAVVLFPQPSHHTTSLLSQKPSILGHSKSV
jgi:hypothetical protein